YDVPGTPLDRLVASEGNDSNYLTSRNNLLHRREELDPFALSREIEDKLQRVYALANVRQSPRASSNDKLRRVTFLDGATGTPKVTFLSDSTGPKGHGCGSVSAVAALYERRSAVADRRYRAKNGGLRSEEHTSELQSRGHLVCRLLLEKKKKTTQTNLDNRPMQRVYAPPSL